MTDTALPTVIGRYVLHAPIARGGMATIHLARLLGAEGFSRTVAAKRLHPQFTEDAEFLMMFLDEARVASKVRHPNVVPMLDVVQSGTEVILVQEYVHGIPLDKLLRAAQQRGQRLPIDVVVAIVSGMLAGLSAAHESKDELGQPLEIVHRDVSPQNVIVGVDGIARLLDFGVAKATLNTHVTRVGVFKGKLGYTSPELLRGVVTRATDIYASGVLLWEALTGRRLHVGLSEPELVSAVASRGVPKVTDALDKASLPPERWACIQQLDQVVTRAGALAMEDRYATVLEMQDALLAAAPAATPAEVSRWVKLLGKEYLEAREQVIASEESSWRRRVGPPVATEELTAASAVSQPAPTLRATVLSVGPSRGRVHWPFLTGLLVIGALLVGIFVMLWRRPLAPNVGAAAPPQVEAPAPEVSTPASAPVIESAPATGSATESAIAASAESRVRAMTRPIVRPPSAVRAAAPAPADDCDPPFRFNGKKKIFKPGCI